MWFFSLTYGLYRNVLYNFQIFGGTAQISFIIDFCYNYIEVWEHILTISTLLYLLKCFIVQNMAYPGKYSMCIWKKNLLCYFLSAAFYKCQLDQVGKYCCLRLFTDFLSTCSFNYWEGDFEIPSYTCEFVYFSFKFSRFLFSVFWSSVFRCRYF